jgi:FMN-dependent NADH-azoreductase
VFPRERFAQLRQAFPRKRGDWPWAAHMGTVRFVPMLLRLDSSADARTSKSREVTEAFARAWAARGPEYTVVHRDLVRDPVPHVTDSALHWAKELRQPGEDPPPEAECAQREILDELTSADVLLVGAPLYNYSLPSTLKAWIDQVHVLGVTTPFGDLTAQPFKGKPAVVAASQGLAYDDGPQQGMDHGVPVLQAILGTALGMDVTVLYTRFTLATRVPRLAAMTDRAAAEHDAALRQAAELATTIA